MTFHRTSSYESESALGPLWRKVIQNCIKIYLWPAWIFAYCLSTLVKKNGHGLTTMVVFVSAWWGMMSFEIVKASPRDESPKGNFLAQFQVP